MILVAKTVQDCNKIFLYCDYEELELVAGKIATKLRIDWEKELINNM
jgi:hypothetical protein